MIVFFSILMSTLTIDEGIVISFGKYRLSRQTLGVVFEGLVKIGIILIAGIGLICSEIIRSHLKKWIMGLSKLLFFSSASVKKGMEDRLLKPLIQFLDNTAKGFVLVRHPLKLVTCFAFSALIWILQAYSYYIFSLGCPGIALSFFELFTVMIIICFFIALPSVPGFWGLWEAGGVFALALFGVPSMEAAGFTLSNHAIQMFPVIIAGFISAMILGVNVLKVSYEPENHLIQENE
jgi:uncharacterized protein (TIRG00374 family)